MKRAELITGKTYFLHDSTQWREKVWVTDSIPENGKRLARYKVTVIETQLKTEHEKQWRTRDVLIQTAEGKEKWVALNHIRCEWAEAVKLLTDERRKFKGYHDRGNQHARHLARKFEREELKPAIQTLCEEIERVTGERVWQGDKIEHLNIKTIKTLTQALSGLKTELTEVA